MTSLTRFLRHLIAPLVAYLVGKDILPEQFSSDATEALVMAVAFLVAYLWSWLKDRRAKSGQGGKNA